MKRKARLDAERFERAHQRTVGVWRGLVTQLRGGAERVLREQGSQDADRMAQTLHVGRDGMAAFVHTKTCRKRNETCCCAGVRLVAGLEA